jgi:hypothetical protein
VRRHKDAELGRDSKATQTLNGGSVDNMLSLARVCVSGGRARSELIFACGDGKKTDSEKRCHGAAADLVQVI